jgi:hypothetical protein
MFSHFSKEIAMSRSFRVAQAAIALSTFVSLISLSSDRAAAAIVNPGFETSGPAGWTLALNGANFNSETTYAAHVGLPSTGRGDAFIRSYWNNGVSGSPTATQVLSDTIATDTQYVLSADVGRYFRALPDVIDIRLLDSTDTELPIVSFLNPTPGTISDATYAQWTKTYETGSIVNAGVLKVVLFASQTSAHPANDVFVAFDNVGLTITAVPEPTSLALAATAVAGISLVRRRRRS